MRCAFCAVAIESAKIRSFFDLARKKIAFGLIVRLHPPSLPPVPTSLSPSLVRRKFNCFPVVLRSFSGRFPPCIRRTTGKRPENDRKTIEGRAKPHRPQEGPADRQGRRSRLSGEPPAHVPSGCHTPHWHAESSTSLRPVSRASGTVLAQPIGDGRLSECGWSRSGVLKC